MKRLCSIAKAPAGRIERRAPFYARSRAPGFAPARPVRNALVARQLAVDADAAWRPLHPNARCGFFDSCRSCPRTRTSCRGSRQCPPTPGCAWRCGRGTYGRGSSPQRNPETPSEPLPGFRASRRRGRWWARRAQQQVAALLERQGEVQAIALAARQNARRLLLVGALEAERRHIGAAGDLGFADLHVVEAVGNDLPQGLVGIDALAILVDVGL